MTGAGGFDDVLNRFSAEVGEALTRASRVAADAAAAGAEFRSQTDHLAERTRSGELRSARDELTDDDLRDAATGFRVDSGLPVEDLPSGRDLLASWGDQDPPAATSGTEETTRSSDPGPHQNDDDEDFSQERIMRRR